MKNLFILFFCFITLNLSGQQWIDIGIKYGAGTNWLLNKNLLQDTENDYLFSFGHSYGAKFGYNFGQNVQFTLDFMHSNFNQKYAFIDSLIGNFNHQISYKTNDIAFLFRYNRSGNYFEFGPQWSKVNSVIAENSFGFQEHDELIIDSYYSLIAGFGAYFIGTDNLALSLGVRCAYGLSDIISEENLGQSSYPTNHISYNEYKPTNPLSIYFVMELNYDLGYLAKGNCAERIKFYSF